MEKKNTVSSDNEKTGTNCAASAPIREAWTIADSPALTQERIALWNAARGGEPGVYCIPAAYIGTRADDACVHAFLCRTGTSAPDSVETWAVVLVCEAADGGPELLKICGSGIPTHIAGIGIPGGWSAKGPEPGEYLEEVFAKAMAGFVGVGCKLIAVLSAQVVAGMNYRFFCETIPVYPGAQHGFALVTIYAALDGHAEISDIEPLVF